MAGHSSSVMFETAVSVVSAAAIIVGALVTYGGYPFEYPRLFPLLVMGITFFLTVSYYLYRRRRSENRFQMRIWTPVIAVLIASACVLSAIACLIYRFWGIPPAFVKRDVGILVAEVPDQVDLKDQTAYQRELINYIEEHPALKDVARVQLIERPLPPDDNGAQAEAL